MRATLKRNQYDHIKLNIYRKLCKLLQLQKHSMQYKVLQVQLMTESPEGDLTTITKIEMMTTMMTLVIETDHVRQCFRENCPERTSKVNPKCLEQLSSLLTFCTTCRP